MLPNSIIIVESLWERVLKKDVRGDSRLLGIKVGKAESTLRLGNHKQYTTGNSKFFETHLNGFLTYF